MKANTEVIGGHFRKRLKSVLAGASEQPRVLRNSMNASLYLLFFAAGNEKGAHVALEIADHLLKKGAA